MAAQINSQSLVTVRCGHTPFILFILLPIFRDKFSDAKRRVRVPKWYIDSNFLNQITNGCSSETRHSHKTCFKPYDTPNDTYSLCICEIFAINFAKRRHNSPGLEMLKNVTSSDVVTEIRSSIIGNY